MKSIVRYILKILGLLTEEPPLNLFSLDRPVDKLIIHCSATPPNMDIGVKEIRKWHKDKGWSDIGYHWVIPRDGVIEEGRPINIIGAHVKGHNTGSLGVCMVGGVDKDMNPEDNFTKKQWHSLELLVRGIKAILTTITIHGHNEFSNKACPSFSVKNWLQSENL